MTREEWKRWKRKCIRDGILFLLITAVACGLPNWCA